MNNSPKLLGPIYGLAGVIIFSLTLPATQFALHELDPYFVSLGRGVAAAFFAALILIATRHPIPQRNLWPKIFITSAGVVLGFPLFATLAMQYVPASHGAVVLAILPLATALMGVLFSRERPSTWFWILSLIGSAVVLYFSFSSNPTSFSLHKGDLLLLGEILAAGIGYA